MEYKGVPLPTELPFVADSERPAHLKMMRGLVEWMSSFAEQRQPDVAAIEGYINAVLELEDVHYSWLMSICRATFMARLQLSNWEHLRDIAYMKATIAEGFEQADRIMVGL